MNRFDDRLDAERYADDPAFGVGLGEGTPGDQDSAWIPERLLARVVALGRAYELHLLPLIEEHEQVHFNSQQAESLAGEVAFVLERVDDPLLRDHGRRIAELVRRGAREATGVTFEGQ